MIGLLLGLAAAVPAPSQLETFTDWIVGCDNVLLCQADGVLPENDSAAATIAIKREPRPDAAPEAWLRVGDGTPVDIAVDGKRLHLQLKAREDLHEIAPADAPRLVAALLAAKSASVIDASGKSIAALSPRGMSAALLYIDDRQRRVGTVTALVRKGPKTASAIPQPPPLPTISGAPASAAAPAKLTPATIAKIRGEDSCDDASREEAPEYSRLDDRTTLALIPEVCNSGAYNFSVRAVLVGNDGNTRDASFDDPMPAEDGVYNAEWHPRIRRLDTYFKGRGIGDCGTSSSYAWDGQRFRLVELKQMNDCRGSIDFITTWRARVLENR